MTDKKAFKLVREFAKVDTRKKIIFIDQQKRLIDLEKDKIKALGVLIEKEYSFQYIFIPYIATS